MYCIEYTNLSRRRDDVNVASIYEHVIFRIIHEVVQAENISKVYFNHGRNQCHRRLDAFDFVSAFLVNC